MLKVAEQTRRSAVGKRYKMGESPLLKFVKLGFSVLCFFSRAFAKDACQRGCEQQQRHLQYCSDLEASAELCWAWTWALHCRGQQMVAADLQDDCYSPCPCSSKEHRRL
jgi:hypothetical protein